MMMPAHVKRSQRGGGKQSEKNIDSTATTKRKRIDVESDTDPIVPSNKKPCLELSLNLSSQDDAKALGAIESKYDIQLQSVISSSKIQQRVTALLRHLRASTSDDPAAADGKPPKKTRLSILRARAPDAGKLISIAEIAKRELEKSGAQGGEGGRWYQYMALGEEKKERPRGGGGDEGRTVIEETVLGGGGGGPNARDPNNKNDKTPRAGDGRDEKREDDGDEDEDEDEDDFEVMKTPLERAIEGRPLVRAVPVLNLFLSRVSVEELKKRYGEQTNAPPTSKLESK
ncbi:hypothetical protein F5X96DRAFT_271496 [Biscogniauxia mediterranea]|nr:hypothetical protein F5X96DRAFT_271496 [Biscogniauxia mediterranea]